MINGRGRTSHSKGCVTCRKRKVKCDERRPTCLRCEKGHRECLGYRKPWVMIHSEIYGQPLRRPSPPTSEAVLRLQSHDSDLIIRKSLRLDGFRDEIFTCHLLHKLYKAPSDTGIPENPVLSHILTNGKHCSAAHAAMLSAGQAFFGRVHGISHMVDESRSQYVKALRQIREQLATSGQIPRGSMQWYACLWGCSFLGMYEMICSSSPTAWIQHSCGMAALIEAVGPHAFQDPSTKVIFNINRIFIAVGCIARRKRTFLERAEWQTIPWANSFDLKPIGICIQDMLCCLPGLMENFDSIKNATPGCPDLVGLLAQVLASLSEANQLRATWNKKNPNARCKIAPQTIGSPLEWIYCFENFDLAAESIHLDVVALLLHGLAEEIWSSLDYPWAYERRDSSQFYALEICRSVDYMTVSSEYDSLGSMVIIFPLRAANKYVKDCREISGWIRDQLMFLSGQKGFNISARLLDAWS